MSVTLFCLFLGSFSIGTTEFVVSGILPAIADDLGVSIPSAGLLVTGYALGVAIGGPVLTLLVARLPKKFALLAVMALFVSGHVLSALAPGYGLLMVGRIVAAVGHGAFFGIAILLTADLAAPGRQGTALSFVLAGITIANIVGVPAGTAIGEQFGWRATFWSVGLLATAAAGSIALLVPAGKDGHRTPSPIGAQVAALSTPSVYVSYVLIVLHMICFWSLNTYVAPYLTEIAGLPKPWLPYALLSFGIAGTIGVFVSGQVANRAPTLGIAITYPCIAGLLAGALLGTTSVAGLGVAIMIGLWTVGAIAIVPLQNRIVAGAAGAPELASALISSIFNLGIAAGAWLGAVGMEAGLALERLPAIGLASALVASIIALGTRHLDPRHVRAG